MAETNAGTKQSEFTRGYNAYQSSRTLLHLKKRELSKQINRDVMLKRGATNMDRFTTNKGIKAQLKTHIHDIDEELVGLKLSLDEANSSFFDYQKSKSELPMLVVGTKPTEDTDFHTFFDEFLDKHYWKDPSEYKEYIDKLNDLRKAIVSPRRDVTGIAEHKEYYVNLSRIECRFFNPDVKRNFFFIWADSFNGLQFKQTSPSFEKACVLFNLGALFSQLGTSLDRETPKGLQEAQGYYMQSARIFRYLKENFSHAPSPDMKPGMLELLIRIVLLQAQECSFLEFVLNADGELESYGRLATFIGRAIALSKKYESQVHRADGDALTIIPQSWTSLFEVKAQYFRAFAYYRVTAALIGIILTSPGGVNENAKDARIRNELELWKEGLSSVIRFTVPLRPDSSQSVRRSRGPFSSLSKFTGSHARSPRRSRSTLGTWRKDSRSPRVIEVTEGSEMEDDTLVPQNKYDASQVGLACLREAINHMENAQRTIRLSEELLKQEVLVDFVGKTLTDWTSQRLQLLEQFGSESGPAINGDAMSATSEGKSTLRGRKALRKATSSVSQYNKKSSNASSRHVAPLLLPIGEAEVFEMPKSLNIMEDFPALKVDPFDSLGPNGVFNARYKNSKPVTYRVARKNDTFGFSIRSCEPLEIVNCDLNSPAYEAGIRSGHLVAAINGQEALWMAHDEAVSLVKRGALENGVFDKNVVSLTVFRVERIPSNRVVSVRRRYSFNVKRPGYRQSPKRTRSRLLLVPNFDVMPRWKSLFVRASP